MSTELQKEIEDVSKVGSDLLEKAKDKYSFLNRQKEKGLLNTFTKSSIALRDNGNINIASSKLSQFKLNHITGYSTDSAIQSNSIANRKHLKIDELVINKHKLNPAIYELSDMRQLQGQADKAIGNLTFDGTVLVKTWEYTLKKWVLIRRPIRMPVFSPTLNLPEVPAELGLNVDISKEILKLSKGVD